MDTSGKDDKVRLIASQKNWIEGEAVRQLEATAKFRNMVRAVGMPDLHPGRGNPVGAAFIANGTIYPHLVGNDIGCGIGLWQTDLVARKLKPEKAARKLVGLDGPWDGDSRAWLAGHGLVTDGLDPALGTIGGGNHFAELARVERVLDPAAAAAIGIDEKHLVLLVHSGSRGLGEAILRAHVAVHGAEGLDEGDDEFAAYLADHDLAVAWGIANRALIAERFLDSLGGAARPVLDLVHNSVTPAPDGSGWLHRKGAAPSDRGPLVVPGSRGSLSYLVEPTGEQAGNAWSVAHGAGRKWSRADAKGRLSHRFRPADLARNRFGGVVVCDDKSLLYEEAPEAYKDIETVIGDLVDAGLVQVVAVLQPVLTYKTRRR